MMNHRRLLTSLAAGLAIGLATTASAATPPRGGSEYAPNQVVVRLDLGLDIEPILSLLGADVLGSILSENIFLLELPPLVSEPLTVLLLQSLPQVEWAHLNTSLDQIEGSTGSFFVSAIQEDFTSQYAPGLIDIPQKPGAGESVLVAVLDSGVDDTHSLLSGRVVSGGYNFVERSTDTDDVGNGIDDDGDGDIDELVGHGTFIAGLIAYTDPQCQILPVRVLNGDGVGYVFQAAEGVHHSIQNGAQIICMSFGTGNDVAILRDIIEDAARADIVMVAAAGNDSSDQPEYPAGYADVMGVAATDASDIKLPMSNYGSYIAISAPGEDIVGPLPGETYGKADGSSLATAWVAGAASLVRSETTLDAAGVSLQLRSHAVDIDPLNPLYAGELGAGRLHIAASVQRGVLMVGDLDQNQLVNVFDLLALLGAWGSDDVLADLDGNGTVDVFDLLLLLGQWS